MMGGSKEVMHRSVKADSAGSIPALPVRGCADIVVIAAWLIVVGFIGVSIMAASLVSTFNRKLDLSGIQEMQSIPKPDNYDKMTVEEKAKYWNERYQGGE